MKTKNLLNPEKLIKMLNEPDTIIMVMGKYDGENEIFEVNKEKIMDMFEWRMKK